MLLLYGMTLIIGFVIILTFCGDLGIGGWIIAICSLVMGILCFIIWPYSITTECEFTGTKTTYIYTASGDKQKRISYLFENENGDVFAVHEESEVDDVDDLNNCIIGHEYEVFVMRD